MKLGKREGEGRKYFIDSKQSLTSAYNEPIINYVYFIAVAFDD